MRSARLPPTAVAPAPHPHAPHYTPSVPGQAPSPRDSQACTLRLGRHAAGMKTLAELKAALCTSLCALETAEGPTGAVEGRPGPLT